MPRKTKKAQAEKFGLTVNQLNNAVQAGVDPWDDAALAEWARKRRAKASAEDGGSAEVFASMKELEMALLSAPDYGTAQKLKTQVSGLKDVIAAQKSAGDLVPISMIDERDTRIAAAVKGALLKLANDTPPMIEGLPADKIQKVLRDQVMGILEQLTDDQSKFWTEHE